MLESLRNKLLGPSHPNPAQPTPSGRDLLHDLPAELQREIMEYLSPKDLLQVARTGKKYAHFLDDKIFKTRFSEHPWVSPPTPPQMWPRSYFQRFRDRANVERRELKKIHATLEKCFRPQVFISARAQATYVMRRTPAQEAALRKHVDDAKLFAHSLRVARGVDE